MTTTKKIDFYNEAQKLEFIEDIDGYAKTYAIFLFNKISDFERKLDTDFCNFDAEYTKTLIIMYLNRSTSMRKREINLLVKYAQWCIMKGKILGFTHPIDLLNSDDFDYSIRHKIEMVKDEEYLVDILNTVYGEFDVGDSLSTMNKLVAILNYYGFNYKEISTIRQDEVDYENKTLRGVKVSDYFLKLTRVANEMTEYETFGKRTIVVQLANNGLLIRFRKMKNSEGSLTQLGNTKIIMTINELYLEASGIDLHLTSNDLIISGMYHDIYDMEQQGKKIDRYIMFDMVLKRFKYSANKRASKDDLVKAEDELLNYKNWKKAFSL